jgi:thioredoxin-like negative regulator of GroEL
MQRKLLILVLVCCSVVAFAQKSKKKHHHSHTDTTANTTPQVDYRIVGSPMPPVKMVTMKGKKITSNDLKSDYNLVVMLFNPTCEHCEDQTELFKKNIYLFKNTKLVMMAGAMMLPYLEYFDNNHKVTEYPNTIMLGVDSSSFIEKAFMYQTLPQINVYNKDRKLVRVFNGNVPMDSLRQYIQ